MTPLQIRYHETYAANMRAIARRELCLQETRDAKLDTACGEGRR